MQNSPRRKWLRNVLGSGLMLISARWARAAWLQPDLASAGAAGPGPAAGVPLCTLAPEQEEGPFYIADELLRTELTEGRPGVPLELRLQLLDSRHCAPQAGWSVEVWSCDALGEYAGFDSTMVGGHPPSPPGGWGLMSHVGGPPAPPGGFGGPGGPGGPGGHGGPGGPGMPPPPPRAHNRQTFLRGIQQTDSEGHVRFATLFPGCYEGRVNHVHLKVRPAGGHTAVAHTGQIFFAEALSLQVQALPPYAQHAIVRTTLSEDHVYTNQHGNTMLAAVQPVRADLLAAGLVAEVTLGIDPSAVPAPVWG